LGPDHQDPDEDDGEEDGAGAGPRGDGSAMEDIDQEGGREPVHTHYVINGGVAVAESSRFSSATRAFFETVCDTAEDSMSRDRFSRKTSNVHELMDITILGQATIAARWELCLINLKPGTYQAMVDTALLCQENDALESAVLFAGLFCAMEFAAHVQWYVKCLLVYHRTFTLALRELRQSGQSKTDIFQKLVLLLPQSSKVFTKNTFMRYYNMGAKCTLLAGAGK
jgi:hypothetical protein